MSAYADTSFLVPLYVPQVHSPDAVRLATGERQGVAITPMTVHEARNAFSLLAFRGLVSPAEAESLCRQFDGDVTAGVHRLHTPVWSALFERAEELRASFSATLGIRSMDLLHVAAAMTLGARTFLTFDVRQAALARKAGLKVRP